MGPYIGQGWTPVPAMVAGHGSAGPQENMARLWIETAPGEWATLGLEHPQYMLGLGPHARQGTGESLAAEVVPKVAAGESPLGISVAAGQLSPEAAVALIRCGPAAARIPTWALIARPSVGVTINGRLLQLGLRMLRHQDEVRIGADRFYYSTEELPRVVAFPAGGRPVLCARCRQPLTEGVPAVCCPQCGTWCHSTEEMPCWRYAERCPQCDQRTSADAGYTWTPAEL